MIRPALSRPTFKLELRWSVAVSPFEDEVTQIIADVFKETFRAARHDRAYLAHEGLLNSRKVGRGNKRRWSAWGTANFLIQESSGLQLSDAAETVPRVRALPLLPAKTRFEMIGLFELFDFVKARTAGELIECLIHDHQTDRFKLFRQPEAPGLKLSLLFENDAKIVRATIYTDPTSTSHYRGTAWMTFGEDASARAFQRQNLLTSDISVNAPLSVFERIAAALGSAVPVQQETPAEG